MLALLSESFDDSSLGISAKKSSISGTSGSSSDKSSCTSVFISLRLNLYKRIAAKPLSE